MTDDAIKRIKAYNENVILVDANPTIENCDYICNDFGTRTQKILNYLYDLGHRNIAYIGGNSSVVAMNGVRQGCKSRGLFRLDADKRS